MNRELFFPTAIYIAELQDLNLNPELEKNIIAWSNKDKGLSRTNVDGWHSQTKMIQELQHQCLDQDKNQDPHLVDYGEKQVLSLKLEDL